MRARSRRRRRLRTTAGPTALPMAYATAGESVSAGAGGRAADESTRTTHSGPDRPRVRLADRAANDRRVRTEPTMSAIRPTGERGPSGAGCGPRPGRLGSACDGGTRDDGLGAASWAGRCASWVVPPGERWRRRATGCAGRRGGPSRARRANRPRYRSRGPGHQPEEPAAGGCFGDGAVGGTPPTPARRASSRPISSSPRHRTVTHCTPR